MDELQCRYHCPACDKAILNRKINRCLYCGATLPQELLLSSEQIAALNEETCKQEERSRQRPAPQIADQPGYLPDAMDGIDIVSDLGSLFD